ncbi:Hypothetical protein PHPALM_19689 [Phytophthora palmivora]|uniref:Uncharacterized protein n=1 Tax=Phytophthora palmivora TaxID=4796 RepID=A0A2P4XGS6_9STRA|nr:Hypothetical protein PHPALM_19689 [Phytophthora palmivora]
MEDTAVNGLAYNHVRKQVYHTRRDYFGDSLHSIVEVPPLLLIQGVVEGWGCLILIDKLKYEGVNPLVDGAFWCVPKPFTCNPLFQVNMDVPRIITN